MARGHVVIALCIGAACASVDSAKVNSSDITVAGGGRATAVVSTWQGGFTAFWGLVRLGDSGEQMDAVIEKNLLTEARAQGADKVRVTTSFRLPPEHPLARIQPLLPVPGLLNFYFAYASAIAVQTKEEAPIGLIEGEEIADAGTRVD